MLDSNEVRADERYVVELAECSDNAAMVNAGYHNREQIREQSWLFLEVKCQRLVVAVAIISVFPGNKRGSYISTFAARTITSLN
jgi:hypothetical protein